MPNPKLKLVLDTGFLIAASLKEGYAYKFLYEWDHAGPLDYELFTSPAILLELQYKLENKFHLNRADVLALRKNLSKIMLVVEPSKKLSVVRDPDDNKILECGVEAKAEVIVSFDKDLLSLKEYEGIKIIHPSHLKYLFPK